MAAIGEEDEGFSETQSAMKEKVPGSEKANDTISETKNLPGAKMEENRGTMVYLWVNVRKDNRNLWV